jgi:ParB-like chromosome segregation protein Spo0J
MITRTEIKIESIDTNPHQNSRKDYGDIETLALRIKSFGLQGIIRVRQVADHPEGKEYTLEDGHRRLAALESLLEEGVSVDDLGHNLHSVWAEVLPEHSDGDRRLLTQLALNTSQNSWTAYEQALHIKKLLDGGVDSPDIQDKMGLGAQAIQQRLALLSADDFVKDALVEQELSFSSARAIISVPDKALREELVREAVTEGLSSRQVELRASELADKAIAEGATTSRRKKPRKQKPAVSVGMRTVSEVVSKIEASQKDLVLITDGKVKARVEGYIEGLQWALVDKNILSSEKRN